MADRIASLNAALVDRYRLERELGSGGMATVYLAHDLRHDRQVAIKVLRGDIAQVVGSDRFVREITIAGRLTHPNILPIFDSATITVDGQTLPCYVMPVVDGESLRARLSRERQLSLANVLEILRDVGSALDHAHAHGIIHRDVKPENILLTGGRAVLADFGIARAVAVTPVLGDRLTSTGIAIGTPAYMSPEQAAADPQIDGRADTYALAVVAYELLAGELPFTGATPQAILARQITGDVLPLSTIRPNVVSPSMDAAIRRALSPAPADRFGTAGDFLQALEGSSSGPIGTPTPHRSRRRTIGIAAVAVAAIAGITWMQLSGGPPADERLGVAVMPFRDQGAATEWSETLPDLVSTFLDGTPGVRVADPWSLWRPLRTRSDSPARSPDPTEADRLSRRAGVRRFVMGSVVRTAERINLTVRIYGVGVSEAIHSSTLSGSVDSASYLAQRTAVEVLEHMWEGTSPRPSVPRMESVLTQSPDALKAYLAAREAMRRGLLDSANAAITNAISIDTTFALGLLEAVLVRSWLQSARGQVFTGLLPLGRRALAFSDSLSHRQRLRLQATLALLQTDGVGAANAWQELLQRDSTDLEAVSGMTYTGLTLGWQYGARFDDVVRYAERGVQLDSTDAAALFRRAAVALARRDTADILNQIARIQAINPAGGLMRATLRGMKSVLASDKAFAADLDSLALASAVEWNTVLRNLRAYRPLRAVQFARRSYELALPGPARVLAANALAGVMGAAGGFRTIDTLWSQGAFPTPSGPPVRLLQRIINSALAGMEDSALTSRAVRELEAYIPVDSALVHFDKRPVWSSSFTLGAWHASRGDTATARRWLETVAQFRAGGSPVTWRESIAADIASRLAERRGDTDSARVLGKQAFTLWTIHTENAGDGDVEPSMRFRYATQLRDAGQVDSAERILRSFVPPTTWLGAYVPLAYIASAEIAEQAGRLPEAARQYQYARELLVLGDAGAVPWLQRAEQGLQRARGTR